VDEVSATTAIARYLGPILLAHGDLDQVVPFGHMARLAAAARRARVGDPEAGPVETLAVRGGQHSWLYEEPIYRSAVARFLATALGGPIPPDEAAAIAAATHAERIPDGEQQFAAVDATPSGFRGLAQVALPGATRRPDQIVTPRTADEPGLG
jgi:hypothetical protein